ncbi:hypothetical protein KKI24_12385 [bacterium]|nr:hypothetical protein [bacterium]
MANTANQSDSDIIATEETQENKTKQVSTFEVSPETIKKIKEALTTPIPGKDEFWLIEPIVTPDKSGKKILGIFKKKSISPEELKDLRKTSIQSPGNTRAKIQKLKKQYPNNAMLYMLSAICTHGMLMNSSNQREVLRGLKLATKEAAISVISNGISVYNCENFFRIYFTFLDRLKRFQLKNLETVKMDPRLESYKNQLMHAIQTVDQLSSEKNRVFNVLNHLKKKLKSSQYIVTFDFTRIREAIRHIENGNAKERVLTGTAAEIIAYIYALTVSFARTPALWSLVDEILKLFPDAARNLLIRKISISSVRNFMKFKLAAIESDRDNMAKLGKLILKENMLGVQKLEGQSLYQSYETDPFFNIAFIAELSVGLYKDDDHRKIIDTAISAIGSLIKRDMSKNHVFTESATNHSHKLVGLRDGGASPKDRIV